MINFPYSYSILSNKYENQLFVNTRKQPRNIRLFYFDYV